MVIPQPFDLVCGQLRQSDFSDFGLDLSLAKVDLLRGGVGLNLNLLDELWGAFVSCEGGCRIEIRKPSGELRSVSTLRRLVSIGEFAMCTEREMVGWTGRIVRHSCPLIPMRSRSELNNCVLVTSFNLPSRDIRRISECRLCSSLRHPVGSQI